MVAILLFLVLVGVGGCAFAAHGGSSVSAEEALARLKEGHARFLAGHGQHPNVDGARRRQTGTEGQHPFAAVVGCSDSRIPVEIVFDQGVGDIFVVRVPGNVCNADEIGAVEYGVEHLGTALCVVLGHTRCGAVTGVVTGAPLEGNLGRLVGNIHHALVKARRDNPTLQDESLVEATARANVEQSIGDLLRGSAGLRERARQGSLKVVGAIYDVVSGAIDWMPDIAV